MSCTHQYVPSTHADYEVCALCGTFHSLAALPPEKLYIGSEYWSEKWGHSSITEQVFNIDVFIPEGGKQTKNEFVRERLEPPDFNTVIELGCAPGILLKQLADMFDVVVGIDADTHYEADIRRISGNACNLQFGLFPACTRKTWKGDDAVSCIIGLDIFEHAPQPQAFLMECYRLLKPGGQLFLMTPFVSDDLPERIWEPREHIFLHSRQHMEQLLCAAGFGRDATFDRWTPGHDTVSAWKV